jgi:hypothetical protein
MQVDIDTLMTWARAHAPGTQPRRRRVRLEIAAESPGCEVTRCHERIVARIWLAEPRCGHQFIGPHNHYGSGCECGPLAETRIG